MHTVRLVPMAVAWLLAAAVCTPSLSLAADDAGRNVAAACGTCHGVDGRSRGDMPSLAGRSRAEIVAAMKAFRDGTRRSTVMQQLARGYSDAQIEAAAAYFAAQKAAP